MACTVAYVVWYMARSIDMDCDAPSSQVLAALSIAYQPQALLASLAEGVSVAAVAPSLNEVTLHRHRKQCTDAQRRPVSMVDSSRRKRAHALHWSSLPTLAYDLTQGMWRQDAPGAHAYAHMSMTHACRSCFPFFLDDDLRPKMPHPFFFLFFSSTRSTCEL